LVRPILTYGAETWAAIESELQKLLIFERKILRKIYGPVIDQDNWRIRTNSESDTLSGGVNIVRYINAQRLRWFGHIQRMEDGVNIVRYIKAQRLRWFGHIQRRKMIELLKN
jgi:hypothetical protein